MAQQDDFDPARVLDGWRVPAPPPIDLDIGRLLDAGRAAVDEAKKERLKARGYVLGDIEDVDLPHMPLPPPINDLPRDRLPVPQARPGPARLVSAWQPQAWTGVARRVRGASAELVQTPRGPVVENHAPQWLCALWLPQRLDAPVLGRWPELATLIGAETSFGALHQMLPQLPVEALLWPAELEVDWALLADIVLHQDQRLRTTQSQALREFAEAERARSFARMNDGYALTQRVARRRP